MSSKTNLLSIVKIRKQYFLVSFIMMCLVGSAFGAEQYVWTGDGLDGLWNTAGNWDQNEVPPHNSGAVGIVYSEEYNNLVITIPAGYTADCTFGDEYGTVYAPGFGMHLDIYGSLTYKWYLSSGQTNPAGQRSIINMYNGSSIYGGEGIAIGDNWWLPGPYVTMNMYGDAVADVNWLWFGGHLNMYGGTMDVSAGVAMCPNVDDALSRVDIYAGKMILPADINEVVINDWISRGILLAYGHTPGEDGYEINIDTTSVPGRTVVTATAGKSGLADLYYLEKDNEAQMWAQMALAVQSIEDGRISDAEAIKENLISNFSSNPRLPEVLFYIAVQYAGVKKYQQAQEIQHYIADHFPESKWTGNAEFESAKVEIYPLVDANDEPNTLAAIDSLVASYSERVDLAAAVYEYAARVDLQNNYKPNSFTQSLLNYVIEKFPQSIQAVNSRLTLSRMNIQSLIESGDDAGAHDEIDTLIADFNNHHDLPMAISLIADSYYNKGLRLQNEGLNDQAAENYRKSITIHEIVIKQLPPSDLTPRSYYFTGALYSDYLQEYQKAIEYFQEVVEKWPEYQFAWDAQYFIGFYYEKLRDSGDIPESEANPKIEQAYQAVVERYPDSEPAPHVAIKLGQINFKKEQWSQAIKYFEFYIEKYPEQLRLVVVPLGKSYEKMGESEMAKKLYQAFINYAEPFDSRIKTVKTLLEKLERQKK